MDEQILAQLLWKVKHVPAALSAKNVPAALSAKKYHSASAKQDALWYFIIPLQRMHPLPESSGGQ